LDEGGFFKKGMDPLALISHPLAMNDPYFMYPRIYTLLQVFFQKGWNLLGRKGMQVYAVLNGDPYRIPEMTVFFRHRKGAPRGTLFCGY
jgi:hypothetical protein